MRKRLRTMLLVLTALLVVLCMAACDDSTGGGNNPPAPPSSEYSIKITPVGSTTIQVSKTVTLRTTVVGTSQKDVTWTSLNENIATVSDKGVVKGVAAGEATIKATLNIDENCSATIKITVEPAVAPETVQIAGYPEDRTGWVGETTQLSVNVTPDNASDAVDWASSDTNVADVSETGVVTYKNKGTVTITATSQSDATKKSTVELNVRKGIYMTAAGSQSWDFSKQDDETDPYIQITAENPELSKGIQTAYAAGYRGSKFYVEAVFTDWELTENAWAWQGFGLGAGLSDNDIRFFTYSHNSPTDGNNFNKFIVRDNPNSWGAITERSQTWGKRGLNAITLGQELKIAMLRNGNEYYYFIDDVLYYVDYTTKYDGVDTIPTVVTFDMPVKVSKFDLVTDGAEVDKILANPECSKSFYAGNDKVEYVNDSDFTFKDANMFAKEHEAHSIGDKAMVMKNFSIEFDVDSIVLGGGGQRFKGVTVNLSRYDSADIVETIGIGRSTEIAENGSSIIGRFFRWRFPEGMEGSAVSNWHETSEPVFDDLTAKHRIKITRTVNEDANESYFRLYVDGEEYAFDIGKKGASTTAVSYDYVGSYLIWIAGEYSSFHISNFDYVSDADVETFSETLAITTEKSDMEVKDTLALEHVFGKTSTTAQVTYVSLDPAVATVTAEGVVTAVAPGKARIEATAVVGGVTIKATKTINVAEIPTLTITNTNTELWPGDTIIIAYEFSSETAHGVTFESSDSNIATVDKNGVVTPVADGTVTITVKDAVNADITASIEINVVTSLRVQITNSQRYIELGDTMQITHRFSFGNTNTVSYKSSDAGIATVSASGLVTPVKAGTFTVTVTCNEDGEVTDTKTFEVVEPLTIDIANEESEMWLTGKLQINPRLSYDADVELSYESSDTAVATVSESGLVTAIGLGNVTITVKCAGRDITAARMFKVNDIVIDTSRDDGNWDYSNLAKADATVSSKGESTSLRAVAVFKNVSGQSYYAEATFKRGDYDDGNVWAGISLANVAADGAIRGMLLGKNKQTVIKEGIDDWGATTDRSQVWNSSELAAVNFESGVKLGLLRSGNKFYYFVNDKLTWMEQVDTRFDGIDTAPALRLNNTHATVSAMFATADGSYITAKLAEAETNRKFYALYPNNVIIDETTNSFEFKNNNGSWPFDNIKDNSALSLGDAFMIERGKDATIEFEVQFKTLAENALVGMFLKCWNNPTQGRSFLVKQNEFGMTGWDINNNQGSNIEVKNENTVFADNLVVDTVYKVKVERIKGVGFRMTMNDKSVDWGYDSTYETSDYFLCFGAQLCNAVISNVTVSTFDHPAA